MKVPMLGLMALLGGEPKVLVFVRDTAVALGRDFASAGAGYSSDASSVAALLMTAKSRCYGRRLISK